MRFIIFIISGALFGSPGNLEQQMVSQGLMDVQSLDPSILVELKYSTPDNFLKADAYGDLETCFLQPPAAHMLAAASHLLQAQHPDLRLLVYDGARPRSVQRNMWALVGGTDLEDYVANPERGSVHNFGAAVDLTLATADGMPLDMGTEFDFFGNLAQPRFEEQFLEEGRLTREQVENRRLLREVMEAAGFSMINVEWWHFNAFPVKETRQRFRIIE